MKRDRQTMTQRKAHLEFEISSLIWHWMGENVAKKDYFHWKTVFRVNEKSGGLKKTENSCIIHQIQMLLIPSLRYNMKSTRKTFVLENSIRLNFFLLHPTYIHENIWKMTQFVVLFSSYEFFCSTQHSSHSRLLSWILLIDPPMPCQFSFRFSLLFFILKIYSHISHRVSSINIWIVCSVMLFRSYKFTASKDI